MPFSGLDVGPGHVIVKFQTPCRSRATPLGYRSVMVDPWSVTCSAWVVVVAAAHKGDASNATRLQVAA